MPATLCRRVVVTGVGGPEVLRVVAGPAPHPAPGHVRIRVEAAGLARADLLMRAGRYPGRTPRPPFTPGWDATGTVDATGPGVAPAWRGRRVTALTLTGGHATHVTVPADRVTPLPDGVATETAACLPLSYLTAHELLAHATRTGPGDRVLVHGAAGAVGTALLDVARLLGAAAVGVGRERDRGLIEGFGATFTDRTHAHDHPADVVLDPIGGAHLRRSLRIGGRVAAYGFLGPDAHPLADLARIRVADALPNGRRATFYRLSRADPARRHAALRTLVAALAEGRLRPLIAARLPLDAVADAHRLAEGGTVRGRILLGG